MHVFKFANSKAFLMASTACYAMQLCSCLDHTANEILVHGFARHAFLCVCSQLGSTAIGIATKEGVVLAVEKRITSPLLASDQQLISIITRLHVRA